MGHKKEMVVVILNEKTFSADPMWSQKAETNKKYLIYLATRDFTRGVLLPGAINQPPRNQRRYT